MADVNDKLSRIEQDLKKLSKSYSSSLTRTRDPIREMREAGFGAFTPDGRKALDMINNRYTGDFLTFFMELAKKYEGSSRQTAEITRIKDVRRKIGELSTFIDQLLSGVISTDPLKDAKKLRDSVQDLDSEFEFFTNSERITKVLSGNIEDVEESTGISLDDLKYAQGLFGRKVKQLTKPPSRIPPELRKFGGDVLKGIGISAFAPFAPFMSPASKMRQGEAERKETLENFALGTASINREEEFIPPSGSFGSVGAGAGGRTRSTIAGSSAYQPGRSMSDELFLFFNTRAGQAKWTRDLMVAVGGKVEGAPNKQDSGSFLGDIAGKLTAFLGPVVAILFAAGIGAIAAKFIGEMKIGDKTVNQHVEGAFTKMLGGDEESVKKRQLQEQINAGVRPETIRAQELRNENPNMTPQEAVAQANLELGIGAPSSGAGSKKPAGVTATAGIDAEGFSYTDLQQPVQTQAEQDAIRKNEAEENQKKKEQYDADVSKYFGPGATEGMNKMEVQRSIKQMKAQGEAEWAKEDRMGIVNEVEGKWARPKVPIDTSQAEIQKGQKDGTDKIQKALDELGTNIKGSGKGKQSRPSGYDANNTRNPVLSSIGAGQITG